MQSPMASSQTSIPISKEIWVRMDWWQLGQDVCIGSRENMDMVPDIGTGFTTTVVAAGGAW